VALAPGTRLGVYEILSLIGSGGMGEVYRARDTRLDRTVAIKILPETLAADPQFRERFDREARTISQLSHPHICTLYDVGKQPSASSGEGISYLVMEHVDGETLAERLKRGPLPLYDALRIAIQIADALAAAHRRGVVHRDIKPANVIVGNEDAVRVLDFGLAKTAAPQQTAESALTEAARVAGSPATKAGLIVGTVAYMSPEQAEGKPIDARSDVFSFGSVLYEMIAGQRPFRGSSDVAILSAILDKDPERLSGLAPRAPRALDGLLSRCFAKDPQNRFQDAGELKIALEELAESLRSPLTARPKQRRWIAVAVGAMTATAAILALVLALRRQLTWPFSFRRVDALAVVLPFQCPGSDPARAVCEGLGETLGRKLQALNRSQRGVRVLRATVYRPRPATVAEARKRMGATVAAAGSVEEVDGHVRLTVRTVDAMTSSEIRRKEFETSLAGISGLQNVLAKGVAEIIGFRWSRDAKLLSGKGDTNVPAAYTLYLEGHGHLLHADRVNDIEAAISLFKQAILADPSYAFAQAGLGEAYSAKSELTKDKQWADRAIEAAKHAIATNADLPDVHVVLGRIYRGNGQFREAVQEFQRAIELDSLSLLAYSGLGAVFEALGSLDDAETTLQAGITSWPVYPDVYNYLGAFYVRQGRYPDAEPVFRKVIELAPDSAVGYNNVAVVDHYLGHSSDSIAMTKKALAIDPTAGRYSNLGTEYFFDGRYSESVPLMEKAVEMEPQNSMFWGNLGDSYRWAPGSTNRADAAYRRAIGLADQQLAMNPNDAEHRASLAEYAAKLQDRNRAMEEIARARRLAPNNPSVLVKSARVYEILRLRDRAIAALQTALESGYSMEEVRHDPEFNKLREDSRFERITKAASARH
jgi:serine/threonine-protein kinase